MGTVPSGITCNGDLINLPVAFAKSQLVEPFIHFTAIVGLGDVRALRPGCRGHPVVEKMGPDLSCQGTDLIDTMSVYDISIPAFNISQGDVLAICHSLLASERCALVDWRERLLEI